jgi:AraC family transcriptional regulator of adaptative response / DNA-3-methyladenine glycosylase II
MPAEITAGDVQERGVGSQAICTRDVRFDGRSFVGTTTSGLYCRNICPVPFAKPERLVLFACAAAAESAGFSACKRCRPDTAPGTPAWLGTSAVVSRAHRLILAGALNKGNLEELAERLGLGSRHLRRLFIQHLGASPKKIATTHRVHLARKLIDESDFSLTRIAFYSGFRSIREFNHAVRLSTGQSPSALRRNASISRMPALPSGLELRLPYRSPYDWDLLIAFLRDRAVRGVEVVTHGSYHRTIEIGGAAGFFSVFRDEGERRILVHLQIDNYLGLAQTVERIRRLFDLGADPVQIASHLSRDPQMRRLLRVRPGLRVPGVWDGFEAAVLAILGQRLSRSGPALRPANRAAARFVEVFGNPIATLIPGLNRLFPRPEVVAGADLSKAGIDDRTAAKLRDLAKSVERQPFDLSYSTLEGKVSELCSVCGLDENTAQYVAMRAFGEPDAFPSQEPSLRRKLAGMSPDRWRPWRAYAAMHITAHA